MSMSIDKIKKTAIEALHESREQRITEENSQEYFTVAGEQFSKKHFYKIHEQHLHDASWLEERLKSLANAHYDGDVGVAAIYLESDLQHG